MLGLGNVTSKRMEQITWIMITEQTFWFCTKTSLQDVAT